MPRHILQVAYYPSLLQTRAHLLEQQGYRVTSVLGNQELARLGDDLLAPVDLALIGFSAPHADRAYAVGWLRAHAPTMPIVVLQTHTWERFDDADAVTLSAEPEGWLQLVATTAASASD